MTPAATIRRTVRALCSDCIERDGSGNNNGNSRKPGHGQDATAAWIEAYHDCYRQVRDHLGLTRSTRSRDVGLVASELRKMRDEVKAASKPAYEFSPEILKTMRTTARMTIADVAESAAVSESMISRIESGDRIPTAEKLSQIAAALGVHPGEFFTEKKRR